MLGIDVGVFNAELGSRDTTKSVTIASIQSLKELPPCDLVIVDEVHEARNRHKKLLENYGGKILTLTATPFDMDEFFAIDECYKIGMLELTNMGYLCPISAGGSKLAYNAPIKATEKQIIEIVSKDTALVERCMDMMAKTSDRNKVVIVCVTIDHAKDVARIVPDCKVLHSKLSKNERDEILSGFERGDFKYLASVLILKKGFDLPSLDAIALFRPVGSAALLVQIAGRLARLDKNKSDGLFLDYGGAIEKLGHPYYITGKKERKLSHQLCPECETFQPTSIEFCECGFQLKQYPEGMTRKERDLFKNIDVKAFNEWKIVHKISAEIFKSKKGNQTLSIHFFDGDFKKPFCTHYFNDKNKFLWRDFLQSNFRCFEMPADINEFEQITRKATPPSEVITYKVDGYSKIIARRF